MKKLTLSIALGLGLSLPFAAMAADDEVTIRVMEMNESSVQAVMQEIQLPDAASDQAQENNQQANREQQRNREMHENGEQVMAHEGEMEQAREMEQRHERVMEEFHEQQLHTEVPESPDAGGMPGPGGHN